ncbi:MAG: PAS domain-containing protein [Bacteroidales bacterium]|jgi:transcriptional regulator with PAS, ATPase and Fis domain|nr:PAS domain-containing protein [Bacteroidales bacterium]MDD2204120.1 PAS domain-containing protein [Bacteroidales bacterium]MDD3152665.1 PAS domain-containing protein [Bacteroidales bacterium]MDD3913784.1 PAS domain-containing protein [Bacteroidales bacterium]MDD4633549.1 PAS domain-containing protein [Bacteroidales bacterium]
MIKDWIKNTNCAITICDADGFIIYMNEKSISTFSREGKSLIGHNLKDCHPPKAWSKIQELITTGGSNAYTIEKNGVKKMIYQTAWFEEDKVGGLIEISMVLPDVVPHYVRESK